MSRFNNYRMKHIIYLNSKMKAMERHSVDWYERRLTTFGGSEISKVLSDPPKWKASKLENANTTNEFCLWGLMFEEVAIENVLKKHPQMSFGFSETLFDTRLPISYSPDGFLYDDKQIFLIEIKCPYYRRIECPMKEEYYAQVQTGMYVCNLDSCLFYQFQFVVCQPKHMDPKTPFDYHRSVHYRKWTPLQEFPVLKGYFIFEETKEVEGPINVGDDIKILMKLDTVHKTTQILDMKDEVNIVFTKPFLCFKLLTYKIDDIKRCHHFIESREDKIWQEFQLLIKK